jgi:hypothetical protein
VNIEIQKMINNHQQTSISNDSTNDQPMINQLQQSVSDTSTLSSTANSDS